MKTKSFYFLLIFIIVILIFSTQTIFANEIKVYPPQPVVVTCPGQNPDGLMIKVVLDKENIDFKYRPFLKAEKLNDYSTLILAVGHSCKGVGAAGIDHQQELNRTKKLIKKAKENNIFIILTHLGGSGRREERSDKLLAKTAPYADYIIISEESDFDGYFSKIAAKYQIPLTMAKNISQIKPIIQKLFASKSKSIEHYVKGDQKNPTIIINAGIHGDESAAQAAALKLLKAEVNNGRLVIIPKANPEAISRNLRNFPENSLLNRSFPGNPAGNSAEKRAAKLFSLIKDFSPSLVIDLHESEDYNRLDKNYVGQTLIIYPEENFVWKSSLILEEINSKIKTTKEKFSLLTPPKRGSLSFAVGKELAVPAVTLETCMKLSFSKRVEYQLELITALVEINGVELKWP